MVYPSSLNFCVIFKFLYLTIFFKFLIYSDIVGLQRTAIKRPTKFCSAFLYLHLRMFRFVKLYIKYTTRNFCSRLNTFTFRTHTCGELNHSHSGKEVIICGWISSQRCDKFLILRDSYGITQVILKENDRITKKYLETLPLESVIQVKGIVQARPKKDVNKKLSTGEIEVEASEVKLLNASMPKQGITAKNINKINDSTKLRYRYLYLRSESIQENLRLRSTLLMKMREFLIEHGFVDVETPTLFKRTPGGAKEFIVPTRFPGRFYSLTQSPQQFKQMLMVGGIDKYFQVARCYRNEGTKVDRQPEFTQVDIELSFTTAAYVQNLVESLINYSWPPEKNKIRTPFPRITYDEAMKLYGTDKPDLRYELKIQDITEDMTKAGFKIDGADDLGNDYGVFMLILPCGSNLIKKALIKDLIKEVETQWVKCFPINIRENLVWNGPAVKHICEEQRAKINESYNLKPGDLLFMAAGKKIPTCAALGKSRTKFAELLQFVNADLKKNNDFSFVWVTDFPLFLQEEGIIESAHHPFTAPYFDDIELVYTEPLKARGQHYDLVLNGQEVAGGSIRIHDSSLQKYILEEVLKESSDNLQHLLEALQSGCPPHGGIALGIDRIVAILCNCHTIADVMAFPKSLDGKDLLSGAPSGIFHFNTSNKALQHSSS